MRNIAILLSVLIITTFLTSFAFESFDEYLKQQSAEYNQYLEEIDREFTAFLKQTWQEYEGEEPVELLQEPKPVKLPVAVPDTRSAMTGCSSTPGWRSEIGCGWLP